MDLAVVAIIAGLLRLSPSIFLMGYRFLPLLSICSIQV